MHKPESVLENETQKILWDFEILADHIILTRILDIGIINNNKRKRAVPVTTELKYKKKRNTYLDLARELRRL